MSESGDCWVELNNKCSWDDAIAEIRHRYQQTVKTSLPVLRDARMRSNVPCRKLARELSVDPKTLSVWERGLSVPPADLFSRWRNLLGV